MRSNATFLSASFPLSRTFNKVDSLCDVIFTRPNLLDSKILNIPPNPDPCISKRWMTKKFSHCLKPFIRPQELGSLMSELSPITQWTGVSHQTCSTAYTAPYSHSSKAINLSRKVPSIKFSFLLQQKGFCNLSREILRTFYNLFSIQKVFIYSHRHLFLKYFN